MNWIQVLLIAAVLSLLVSPETDTENVLVSPSSPSKGRFWLLVV